MHTEIGGSERERGANAPPNRSRDGPRARSNGGFRQAWG
ncbi:hypothetical protein LC55x_3706 [Lysobacter capsici]|nr:hypothetical protein LC55x_3706 [Lysobacter capsici]